MMVQETSFAHKLLPQQPPLAWLLVDAQKTGTLRQAEGLVQGLGLAAKTFLVSPRGLWPLVPRRFWRADSFCDGPKTPFKELLAKEPPAMLMGAGATGSAAVAALGCLCSHEVFKVALMNPRLPLDRFDAVIAPCHDRLKGPQVIATALSPHAVTLPMVQKEAARFRSTFSPIPLPRLGVLLGGSAHRFRLNVAFAQKMGRDLRHIHLRTGAGLLITPSRRTSASALQALREALGDTPCFFWNGDGDNPYHAILGAADYLMVTGDSVQMLSEAAATTAPLYVYDAPGLPARLRGFHSLLYQQNLARPFRGYLETWLRPAVHPNDMLIKALRTRMAQTHPHILDQLKVYQMA
jgi:mitochondrial fission protein ELM1